MNKRYVITELEFQKSNYRIVALLNEKNQMVEVSCEPEHQASILGNIYIGKVKDVVKNLNAAFIDIGGGIICYYSMEDLKKPLFTRKIGKKPLCIGDELVVQVSKEAVKTKFPSVTTNLNFNGKYLVLTTENNRLGISRKLPKDKRIQLKEMFAENKAEKYGIIVRTNAATASESELWEDYVQLKQEYDILKETSVHKTAFSLLKGAEPFYFKELLGTFLTTDDEIVTDLPEVYGDLQKHAAQLKLQMSQIRLYEDAVYPLSKLYALENGLKEALQERVWLKSGAYLIISPTEALTVIDVNSGKNIAGKNPQENFRKINQEAAIEIAHQLRLRNISGICIVDFINVESRVYTDELMHSFRMALKEDPIQVNLIDITKLGLVELTRKKVKRSLREQLRS